MRPAQLFGGIPRQEPRPGGCPPYPVDRHSLTSGKSQPCVSSISGQKWGHPQSPATLPDGKLTTVHTDVSWGSVSGYVIGISARLGARSAGPQGG